MTVELPTEAGLGNALFAWAAVQTVASESNSCATSCATSCGDKASVQTVASEKTCASSCSTAVQTVASEKSCGSSCGDKASVQTVANKSYTCPITGKTMTVASEKADKANQALKDRKNDLKRMEKKLKGENQLAEANSELEGRVSTLEKVSL